MLTWLDRYRDVGLLILRLGFGLGFFYFHGSAKLMGGADAWAGNGEAMANLGITFGYTFWGFAAAFAEGIGGLLFAAGLFFRPACVLLASVMFVATFEQWSRPVPVPEHSVKNLSVFIGMFVVGPGRYSLDHLFTRKRGAAEIG